MTSSPLTQWTTVIDIEDLEHHVHPGGEPNNFRASEQDHLPEIPKRMELAERASSTQKICSRLESIHSQASRYPRSRSLRGVIDSLRIKTMSKYEFWKKTGVFYKSIAMLMALKILREGINNLPTFLTEFHLRPFKTTHRYIELPSWPVPRTVDFQQEPAIPPLPTAARQIASISLICYPLSCLARARPQQVLRELHTNLPQTASTIRLPIRVLWERRCWQRRTTNPSSLIRDRRDPTASCLIQLWLLCQYSLITMVEAEH